MRQNQLAINIDMAQLTTGLSAIMGIGEGFAKEKHMIRALRGTMRNATDNFSIYADGNASQVAHVYEYGRVGDSDGRLFRWDRVVSKRYIQSNIRFIDAKVPTSRGEGIDPRIYDSAIRAGTRVSSHYFPKKAIHLEQNRRLTAIVGVRQFTERVDSTEPKTTVYMEGGRVRFGKSNVRVNTFYQRFEGLFTSYWRTIAPERTSTQVYMGLKRTMDYSASKANRRIRAASMLSARQAAPQVMRVQITDGGKPFTGVFLRQRDIKMMETRTKNRLKKELKRGWSSW